MIQGFKEFIMRGNVIDLAIAVVIGGAFNELIGQVVDHFVTPIINAFGGGNVTGIAWQIVDGNEASTIDFAAIVSAVLAFLVTAAVVYFLIVVPMNKINERRVAKVEPEAKEIPIDTALLTEIRDLLRQRQL